MTGFLIFGAIALLVMGTLAVSLVVLVASRSARRSASAATDGPASSWSDTATAGGVPDSPEHGGHGGHHHHSGGHDSGGNPNGGDAGSGDSGGSDSGGGDSGGSGDS